MNEAEGRLAEAKAKREAAEAKVVEAEGVKASAEANVEQLTLAVEQVNAKCSAVVRIWVESAG